MPRGHHQQMKIVPAARHGVWLDSFLGWNEWGTNGERMDHGAEILLVGWEGADGQLLETREGPLRGGLGC